MNSRQKGAAGEREWAKYLRDTFGLTDARRGVQFCGSSDSPDCTGSWEGTHTEVKRVEKFYPHKWMEQAVRDADGKLIPYVAHRQNGRQWLVTVQASDLLEFCHRVVRTSGSISTSTRNDSETNPGSKDTKPARSGEQRTHEARDSTRDTTTGSPLLLCCFSNG